jgi:uncharacterized protein YhhL (DUF1145 family)
MPSAKFMHFCNKLRSTRESGHGRVQENWYIDFILVVYKANCYCCAWRILLLYLEPFPSPAAVVFSVDEDKVRFFTNELEILCLQSQNGDKVPTGLTTLAPQIGMDLIV